MRTKTDLDYQLKGRLEHVYIARQLRDTRFAIGSLRSGGTVFVDNAMEHLYRDCLVRRTNAREAVFISHTIPRAYQPLDSEEYVLCAVWEPWMGGSAQFPRFRQVKRVYDPRQTQKVFCSFAGEAGKAVVRPSGYQRVRSHASYKGAIEKHLSTYAKSARLILVDDAARVSRLDEVVQSLGLSLVQMTPRKRR